LRLLTGVLFVALCAPALAEPPADVKGDPKKAEFKKPEPSKFLRIQRDEKKQPAVLETATVRYVPASGEGDLVVDLIGVVHIGEKDYYQKLNKQFEQYDVLLYELVAPQGARPPKGGKKDNDNPLGMIQKMAKMVLQLDSQLEVVDYTKKNFVHADMSPEEMMEAIKKRGDDGLTLTLGILGDVLRQQNKEKMKGKDQPKDPLPDIDLADLLLDPDAPVKLKRMMAQQFEDLDDPDGGLGKTVGVILIEDRNKAAMKVFQKEMAKGKKKIGIFYGAAHMPDFEKRLREDYGLKKKSEEWLPAWDLRLGQKKNGLEDLLKKFLE